MIGKIVSPHGLKSSYKASFLGKNLGWADSKTKYSDRNRTYSSVYNMSLIQSKQSSSPEMKQVVVAVSKPIEAKLMNFDTVTSLQQNQ